MRLCAALVLGLGVVTARGQMAPPEDGQAARTAKPQEMQNDDGVDPTAKKVSTPFAAKAKPAVVAAKASPLTPRERVQQVLDRFTFGARPGEVDRVLANGGVDAWVTQQMNPDAVGNGAWDRRAGDFPTVNMTTEQALAVLPNRQLVDAVSSGKTPFPADPLQNAVYEVLVRKWRDQQDIKKADGTKVVRVDPTDAEKAAQKKVNQATASRIFGELIALPKQQRMPAIIALSVDDRIALTDGANLPGDQRNLLLNDFSAKEREAFQAMSNGTSASYQILNELAQARVVRDVVTERQMQEVMTDFWFNHFNIFGPKDSDELYTTAYERDVIRKHALGSFKDLLLATAESPAMMVYLDNYLSIGPDSLANGVDPRNPNSKKSNKGLNENYGREVMELHTVGVSGGYSQADVTALSAILTGWGVDRAGQGGPFLFDPKRHEPGPKLWFGHCIADDGAVAPAACATLKPGTTFGPSNVVANADSVKQGITALTILAEAPQTAHFISYLLAQHFVADVPPPALVDRLQKVFESSHGDIKTVLRALIASPEFNSRQYFHNKVKTPIEFIASAFRTTGTDPQNPNALVGTIRSMGMPLYNALPPTGYYLTADQWMNSVALIDRLNFAYQLTTNRFANQKFDAPRLLAVGLLLPGGAPAGSAPVASGGTDIALRVLEATVLGGPASAQTNQLIKKQMDQQPAGSSPTDTLNVLTALVLGSPEFQVR